VHYSSQQGQATNDGSQYFAYADDADVTRESPSAEGEVSDTDGWILLLLLILGLGAVYYSFNSRSSNPRRAHYDNRSTYQAPQHQQYRGHHDSPVKQSTYAQQRSPGLGQQQEYRHSSTHNQNSTYYQDA